MAKVRQPVADEGEARRGLLAAAGTGQAAFVEHAQVTDQGFEAVAIAGCGDHHARPDVPAASQDDVRSRERLDGADDLDAACLDRLEQAIGKGGRPSSLAGG